MSLLRRRARAVAGRPLRPRVDPTAGLAGLLARLRRRWSRFLRRRRRVRPTREGWVFLGASLAVALAALNTGNNLLYLVFATMLSMVALSGVLSELSVQRVIVQRTLGERVYARTEARGTWTLHNPRRLFANLAIRLREGGNRDALLLNDAAARFTLLGARETERRSAGWTFDRRGIHRLEAVRVSTTWPFGIFEKWYELPAPLDVLVHPQPRPGGAARPLPAAGEGDHRPGRRRGQGELLGLRDHRSGEDPRLIHWRTTARLGRRIAVDRAQEDGGRVLISVPVPAAGEGAGDAFELSVSMATGAVLRSLRAGRRVVLDLPGQRLEGGAEDADHLLRALALAEVPP